MKESLDIQCAWWSHRQRTLKSSKQDRGDGVLSGNQHQTAGFLKDLHSQRETSGELYISYSNTCVKKISIVSCQHPWWRSPLWQLLIFLMSHLSESHPGSMSCMHLPYFSFERGFYVGFQVGISMLASGLGLGDGLFLYFHWSRDGFSKVFIFKSKNIFIVRAETSGKLYISHGYTCQEDLHSQSGNKRRVVIDILTCFMSHIY